MRRRMLLKHIVISVVLAAGLAAGPLQAEPTPRPDQIAFRALYRELVETDTSVATGSCTRAADLIAARLRAAGFAGDTVRTFVPEGFPLDGGVVARLDGTEQAAPAMLLLGHLDVVNARREDWQRDPFTFIEEGGYFYGRGSADMKVLDAIWIDTLVRLKQQGFKPRRTIRLALTCGEESGARVNGAQYLAEQHPELIAAAFALNEGGGGTTDGHGKLMVQKMQIGEKSNRSYELTATNPGGHSSIPVTDNAIYELADALVKVRGYTFPVRFNATTRAYFTTVGASRMDALGRAILELAANPADRAAEAIVVRDRGLNSMLRTTCVATLLDGGHAINALPQRAKATINCRIAPGEDETTTRTALVQAIGDSRISVTMVGRLRPIAVTPPLDLKIVGPAQAMVARYFPGVPLVPSMSTGASDATYMALAKIPTYGVPGVWGDPDGNGTHGLNERMEVKSAYVGRDFLFDLVKAYANQP